VSALNTICVSLLRIPFEPSAVTVVANTRSPVWLAAAAVFVAPISEELLFRGFAFAGLQRRYGWVRGALFSSLAFAVIHLQPAMILAYFGIGFLLALLYYWTNSLWPCVAVHAAVNGIGILAASYLASQLPAP
jgi:membrane protease YdiL (CAAX protease family)